jgi:hypothetical protein
VSAALKGLENGNEASAVLAAVVREFHAKADKALRTADGGRAWEAVIELDRPGHGDD